MSDEQTPGEQPTDEELLAVMNDANLLKEEGYRILPKGHMAMVLMEMGVPSDLAETITQTMSDRIFLDGWIYVRHDQVRVADPSE